MDTAMDWVFLGGRVLIALLFLYSAFAFHFKPAGVAYARESGVPLPRLFVPLSGLLILAGAVMVGAGIWGDLGALLLIAFLLPVTFSMHAFWKEEDPQSKLGQKVHFAKNAGLIGGAAILFYAYHLLDGEAPLSVTGPLFLGD